MSTKTHENYGEQFEPAVIFSMVLLIVLSILGVVYMQVAASSDCKIADQTYCGENYHIYTPHH